MQDTHTYTQQKEKQKKTKIEIIKIKKKKKKCRRNVEKETKFWTLTHSGIKDNALGRDNQ